MRRLRFALALGLVIATLAVPAVATAHGRHGHGSRFVQPHHRVHGHTQRQIVSDWGRWVFGSPLETNAAIAGRCEADPRDPKIWFLPVALAEGQSTISCQIPQGAYLVLSPGGYECSEAEGNGSTAKELRACAKAGFKGITAVSVTLKGREYTKLDRYIITSRVYQLPGPNLFGPDPGPSLTKGYFLFIKPMRPGHHVIQDSVTFADGFEGGFTYEIEVVAKKKHKS